jgi:hypothetical protein
VKGKILCFPLKTSHDSVSLLKVHLNPFTHLPQKSHSISLHSLTKITSRKNLFSSPFVSFNSSQWLLCCSFLILTTFPLNATHLSSTKNLRIKEHALTPEANPHQFHFYFMSTVSNTLIEYANDFNPQQKHSCVKIYSFLFFYYFFFGIWWKRMREVCDTRHLY